MIVFVAVLRYNKESANFILEKKCTVLLICAWRWANMYRYPFLTDLWHVQPPSLLRPVGFFSLTRMFVPVVWRLVHVSQAWSVRWEHEKHWWCPPSMSNIFDYFKRGGGGEHLSVEESMKTTVLNQAIDYGKKPDVYRCGESLETECTNRLRIHVSDKRLFAELYKAIYGKVMWL